MVRNTGEIWLNQFSVLSWEFSAVKNDRESDEGVPRIPDQRIPAETQKALPPSLLPD